ncbi:MAG: YdeI/OmpD-associated family protein [Gemmatimonadota bacterium]|nr:YdeI/OmpD-associated family protein [Gemmatimonadota bacterium]
MAATFFPTPHDFRNWLAEHHDQADELWVGYYKKATGRPSMTWPESVDEALCYGWIDGLRRSIDEASYQIRFTPRRRGSHWSRVNLERVTVLTAEGRVTPAGLAVYEAREPEKAGRYSFEQAKAKLSSEQRTAFKANGAAWAFWTAQPPGYRKQATWWVVSAKREETRARRLGTLIQDSANGLRIKQLRRG